MFHAIGGARNAISLNESIFGSSPIFYTPMVCKRDEMTRSTTDGCFSMGVWNEEHVPSVFFVILSFFTKSLTKSLAWNLEVADLSRQKTVLQVQCFPLNVL